MCYTPFCVIRSLAESVVFPSRHQSLAQHAGQAPDTIVLPLPLLSSTLCQAICHSKDTKPQNVFIPLAQ